LRVNHEIRAQKVRVISAEGEQLGVFSIQEAMAMAREAGMDLVEVVGTSVPPVCKVVDYGKFRYDQTKKERESRKTQHQVKVKEVKFGPNISEHDLEVKVRHAREFLEKGNKVKFTCSFRGREITHPEIGERVFADIVVKLDDVSMVEASPKLFGKMLGMVLAPAGKKKKKEEGV
jgi:translation initiation factor IF-3